MSRTTGTRTCLLCAREIEWIEVDGAGAWTDLSNQTGCPDGGTPHAPGPFCGWCEDYGLIEIFHPSTDGLIGHRRCDIPECVARGEERGARAAERHTGKMVTSDEEFVPQVCAQCGFGGYIAVPGLPSHGQQLYACAARGCGHTAGHDAFTLEDGERLTVHNDGRLYVVRPYSGPPF
ncbi:hypothetical protein ACIQWZ_38890 [Streptomyces sp. NPDC098077]|uniref:hypothetical protein n=1 Tax=Streptomyces sp. NPDC098077 TaxID=3366093 RepID=UPI003830FA2F